MKSVVLLGVLALIVAQVSCFHFSMPDISFDPDDADRDPEKHEACCVPERWEGHKCIMLPSRDYLNEAKYSYDAKDHRDFTCGYVVHQNQVIKYEMLRLFKEKKQYISVEPESAKKGHHHHDHGHHHHDHHGHHDHDHHDHDHGPHQSRRCTAAPLLMEWKDFCIPKDAKHLGTSTVGAKLEIDSWNFTISHPHLMSVGHEVDFGSSLGIRAINDMVIALSVTKKGCIPVNGLVFPANQETELDKKRHEVGPRRWPNLQNVGIFEFLNITKGIKDDKVFEVPRGCSK